MTDGVALGELLNMPGPPGSSRGSRAWTGLPSAREWGCSAGLGLPGHGRGRGLADGHSWWAEQSP